MNIITLILKEDLFENYFDYYNKLKKIENFITI